MRYFSNRLANFDDICMAMHISRFNPIVDYKIRKFENPILWTATILKIEKRDLVVRFWAGYIISEYSLSVS